MGIIAWIQQIAQGKSTSYHDFKTDNNLNHVDRAEDDSSLHGLNFQQAIEAHQQWKHRLLKYVEGVSQETLDPHVICCDDKCVLGIWIHTSGRESFGHLPLYSDIKDTHAQFHTVAGDIVTRKQSGDAKGADNLLNSGLYTKLSVNLQMMLAKLYLGQK